MSGLTGPEWRGESLPYGTIVAAPRFGAVALVVTGMEGAVVDGWYPLRKGEHALVILDPGDHNFGKVNGVQHMVWMQDYESESIRWHISLEDQP